MKTIWKYPLQTTDHQTVEIPENGEILTVQLQNGEPCMWVLVNPESEIKEIRKFDIFGTGHQIKDVPRQYIGTYQIPQMGLVFHVFERKI